MKYKLNDRITLANGELLKVTGREKAGTRDLYTFEIMTGANSGLELRLTGQEIRLNQTHENIVKDLGGEFRVPKGVVFVRG